MARYAFINGDHTVRLRKHPSYLCMLSHCMRPRYLMFLVLLSVSFTSSRFVASLSAVAVLRSPVAADPDRRSVTLLQRGGHLGGAVGLSGGANILEYQDLRGQRLHREGHCGPSVHNGE